MTGKTVKGKIIVENDIEKNREEGNWSRVIELADLLIKQKPPLYNFLIGEAKLESYLEHVPPIDKNTSKARIGLAEAKHYLSEAVTEQGDKCGVALDGHLLLGKVQYAVGDYNGALNHFNKADLQGLTEKSLAPRSIRIIAESFAIKGLCLEKNPPQFTSDSSHNEWIEEIKRCYETAANLGFVYLQQQDKQNVSNTTGYLTTSSHSSQPSSHLQIQLSILIETAILRAPIFLLEHDKLIEAISFYRNMLSSIEANGTQHIRLILCRQLAELLLIGFAGKSYVPPSDNKKTARPWKPQKYSGINLFCPRNEYEETILLLLISEAMATMNTVLSQSPEFEEIRTKAFKEAVAVYDLLTIALIRWRQFSLLQESLDRAMKFSHKEAHVWLQHALCLDATGRHLRALTMIKEVIQLRPDDTQPRLIAARIAYQNLKKIDEGLQLSEDALKCELKNPDFLLSRCYLYVGIGAHCKFLATPLKSTREKYSMKANDSFLKARRLDPNDHLVEYYLGLHHAFQCKISEAVSYVKSALSLNPEHLPSLHLMILLLTAQKQMKEASELLDSIMQDYPDNIILHFLKVYLELHLENYESALIIGKRILSIWKMNPNFASISECCYSDSRLLLLQELSEGDSNSLQASQSLIMTKVEHTLSDGGASTINSMQRSQKGFNSWSMQHKIWLLLAEIYLKQDQVSAATNCLQEATSIFPISHHIMYMKGRIYEYKNEYHEAKQAYQHAISINPTHIKSLQRLGLMFHYFGYSRLAEKTLRIAAKLDPLSAETWYNLGTVLEALGEIQSATDCLTTALQIETVSPVLPYNTIAITFE